MSISLSMNLAIEFDREDDGRWIADVVEIPGVVAYGSTKDEALIRVKALTLRTLADRMEEREDYLYLSHITFSVGRSIPRL